MARPSRILERGSTSAIMPFKWQNDDSVGWSTWGYMRNAEFKPTDVLIHELVDVVSKNGNLLLNVPPDPDGTIPKPVVDRLLAIGQWLQVNGEAIYGTRPFTIFGEGPTRVKPGHMGADTRVKFTSQDFRFTVKGDVLYAICLGWPAHSTFTVKSLDAAHLARWSISGKVDRVELLGCQTPLTFAQDANGLTITLPETQTVRIRVCVQDLWAEDIGWKRMVYPDHSGTLTLDAEMAEYHGTGVRSHMSREKMAIANWSNTSDWVSWKVTPGKVGVYQVTAMTAADSGESSFVVEIAGQKRPASRRLVVGMIFKAFLWETFI